MQDSPPPPPPPPTTMTLVGFLSWSALKFLYETIWHAVVWRMNGLGIVICCCKQSYIIPYQRFHLLENKLNYFAPRLLCIFGFTQPTELRRQIQIAVTTSAAAVLLHYNHHHYNQKEILFPDWVPPFALVVLNLFMRSWAAASKLALSLIFTPSVFCWMASHLNDPLQGLLWRWMRWRLRMAGEYQGE